MPFYHTPSAGLTRRMQRAKGAIELQFVDRDRRHTVFDIQVFNGEDWMPHGQVTVQLSDDEDPMDIRLAALQAAAEYVAWCEHAQEPSSC